MSEWLTAPLHEVLEFREGPGIMAVDFRSHGVPLIRLAGLKRGSDLLTGCNYLDPAKVERRWNQFRVEEGDVLLSTSASLGEVAMVRQHHEGAVPYTGIIIFRPRDERILPKFIPHMLTNPTFVEQIQAMGVGSVMKHFGPSHLRKMTVTFPARVRDQRAIAEVLGALDDKIAANTATVNLVAALAHARVQRASAGCSPVALSSITTMTTRGITPRYTTGEGWTVLNQKCVRDHEVSLEPARVMEPKPSAADRLLRSNDLLVNSTGQGTLGRTARWTTETETVTVDSHITIVRFDEQQVDPAFAGIAALSLDSQIELLAEGSTGQTELRRDLLGALTLRLPDLATQTSVGDQIRQQDASVNAMRYESARLRATRDELLPLLMSGRLSVRDAERTAENVT